VVRAGFDLEGGLGQGVPSLDDQNELAFGIGVLDIEFSILRRSTPGSRRESGSFVPFAVWGYRW
jgi:hypothetical protein